MSRIVLSKLIFSFQRIWPKGERGNGKGLTNDLISLVFSQIPTTVSHRGNRPLPPYPLLMEGAPDPARHDEIHSAPRAVVLPEDTIREEKVVRGVEMTHRSITKEDKELAAAGYDHLSTPKDPKAEKETNIDIHEHNLPFDGLTSELKTNFDLKDPGHSFGLTSDEAKDRLARDGPNMLTPPKKKSALRKVCPCLKLSLTIT